MSAVLDVSSLSPMDLPLDDTFGGGSGSGVSWEDGMFSAAFVGGCVDNNPSDSRLLGPTGPAATAFKSSIAKTEQNYPDGGFSGFGDYHHEAPLGLFNIGDSEAGLMASNVSVLPSLPVSAGGDLAFDRSSSIPHVGSDVSAHVLRRYSLDSVPVSASHGVKFPAFSYGQPSGGGASSSFRGQDAGELRGGWKTMLGPGGQSAPLLEPSLTSGEAAWNEDLAGAEDMHVMLKMESVPSKSRWKPNSQQLCLLEQHFKSGYTKATPELYCAVKGCGYATEAQVSVWLKNRLARCKRQPKGEQKSDGCSGGDSSGAPGEDKQGERGAKRSREESLWDDFEKVQHSVFDELASIMRSIDSKEVLSLARTIKNANKVCCYGVGREGLAMKGLATNLYQLGIDASVVGDTAAPVLGKGDAFLVAAGPSYYGTVNALSLEALRSGAEVIAFTAHKTAPLPFASRVFRIASQTLPPNMPVMNRKLGGLNSDIVSSLPDGKFSVLQMGASFEVSLSLIMECVCIMLRKKMNTTVEDMCARSTNLH
ncbi:hypothetical protein BSKO_13711 [Bryopsis sp. KO-2023]|nr:hypothetical protein BSKO_13711 [Bryopsis sp. KO-2023]